MTDASPFIWPDDPPEDFWLTTGAQLGMSEDLIRFAATLFRLGGADAKKNSVAARLAGLNVSRTQAFRYARSVAVRRLLDQAEEIKTGKRVPISEDEIDQRIEGLIRSPDATMVARGVELFEKRRALRKAEREVWEEQAPQAERDRMWASGLIKSLPFGGGPGIAMGTFFNHRGGDLTGFPYLQQCAPLVANKYPDDWSRWLAKHDEAARAVLLAAASGPELTGDDLIAAVEGRDAVSGEVEHA